MNINTSFTFYTKLVIVINAIVLASLCLFCPYSQMKRKMSSREEMWQSGTDGVACPSGLSFAACINVSFGNHELRMTAGQPCPVCSVSASSFASQAPIQICQSQQRCMVSSSQHRGWKQTPTLLPSQRSTKIITVDDICDMSLYITCHIVINFAEQPHLMLTKILP